MRPTHHAFAAATFANQAWQGFHGALVVVMALHVAARVAAGLLGAERRVSFDCVSLFWLCTVCRALAGLALCHLFPRLAGGA